MLCPLLVHYGMMNCYNFSLNYFVRKRDLIMGNKNISLTKGQFEDKISIEELKTLFAQCLQIDNLNFLLGAGCSSFLEADEEKAIPTMGTLTNSFYSYYQAEKNEEFTLNNGIITKDKYPNNIENAINHLISYRNICEEDKVKETTGKITEINKYIFNQISKGTSNDTVIKLYKNLYSRIVHNNRKIPINIYTTNYDMYNESALDDLKYVYNNGFSGGSKRVFNPNTYNYILVENLNLSKNVWHSISNFVNIFKIHGSISWIKENNTIIERELEIIKNKNQYESLIIYPTPEKDRSTLMTPYSDLFRIMQNNLLKKNSILVTIGYSFGDEHLNRIILNALSVFDFRLVVFGDSDKINELKEIGDSRVWVVNSDQDDYKVHYFKNFVDDVLPKLDDEQKELQKLNENISKIANVLKGETND